MDNFEKIKNLFEEKHKGKKNGIKSSNLAEEIGVEEGPSTVNIRNMIRETIKKYSIPIGATYQDGYFLMKNEAELKSYMKFLDNKMQGIEDRKHLLYGAYYRYYDDEELKFTREMIGEEEFDEDELGDFTDI
jgi:hypothetical protein